MKMVRLDFSGLTSGIRAIQVGQRDRPGLDVRAALGPRLPFRPDSVDEVFLDDGLAHVEDFVGTLEELWRICLPGALIHLRLPHASSSWAATRDPRHPHRFTLETFNYFDPRFKDPHCPTPATFRVEQAELRVTGARGDPSGLALARGPVARFIERFANRNRGMQYRAERWFAGLFGGFEEMSVVLAVEK